MLYDRQGIYRQHEKVYPLQPLENAVSPVWEASLRRCLERFKEQCKRGSQLRGVLVQAIAPVDYPLKHLFDSIRPHLSRDLRADNYLSVWDGPELPRRSGWDKNKNLVTQLNPIQTIYVFGTGARERDENTRAAYADTAEQAGNVLAKLPSEISRILWGDWADGFYYRESVGLWTAAVFRLAWERKLVVTTKRVTWEGMESRIIDGDPPNSRFFAQLDNLFLASVEAAEFLLTREAVPDATPGTQKSEEDAERTTGTPGTSDDDETNRFDGLGARYRKAYIALEYVALKTETKPGDLTFRDVHEWISEHGIDTDEPGMKEFRAWKLPRCDTLKTYLSRARAFLHERKNQPRAGRTGRSIVQAENHDWQGCCDE